MKKQLLAALLFIACTGIFADDIKATWFDTFYEATKANTPEGCVCRKDASSKIVFLDMPLPVDSNTQFNVDAAKQAILETVKGTPDADFIKKAEITVIYNYVTTDYKVNSVVITGNDL